jgi:hypothetical protein
MRLIIFPQLKLLNDCDSFVTFGKNITKGGRLNEKIMACVYSPLLYGNKTIVSGACFNV